VIVAQNRLDVDGVMIKSYALLVPEMGQEVEHVDHGFTMDAQELLSLLGLIQQVPMLYLFWTVPRGVWTMTNNELQGLVAMSSAVSMPECVPNMLHALNNLETQ
jgi:hypothetical protein